jgi:hypothetical protein
MSGEANAPLPDFLRPLFWDTNFDQLHVAGHERYIIERVLEHGDTPAVRWMLKHFTREQVVEVLRDSRRISRKSAGFWAAMLDVPAGEVRCLSTSSHSRRDVIWPR